MFMFSEYSMWLCERMKIYTNTCIFVCISSTENYWDDTVRTIRWLKCILTQTYTHTNGVYIRLRTMTKAILLAATMFISSFASFLQFGSFFLSLLVVVLPLLLLHCYCECAVLPFSHNTHRTHGPIHGETSRRAFKRQTEIELSTLTFKLTITLHSLTIWLVGSDNCTHGSATVAPTHTHWHTQKTRACVYSSTMSGSNVSRHIYTRNFSINIMHVKNAAQHSQKLSKSLNGISVCRLTTATHFKWAIPWDSNMEHFLVVIW